MNSKWYTLSNIEEIEDFDPDQYGNIWYNAKLAEHAETVMWLAKEKPDEGKTYYGHLEPTKSGKRYRFKRDPVPEDGKASTSSAPRADKTDYEPGTNARWAIGMAYRAFVSVTGTPENAKGEFPFDEVKQHAQELVKMFDQVKSGSVADPHISAPIKESPPSAASKYQFTDKDIPEEFNE